MRIILIQIIIGMTLLFVGCNEATVHVHNNKVSPVSLTGQWFGKTYVIVEWCQTKSIPVNLTISSDGSITGKVGDAQLVGAELNTGRGNWMRSMDWGSDYIIKAGLDGYIVTAEQIHRDRVKIIFDFIDGKLKGAVHTSGSEFGGKRSMRFSTTNLILEKIEKMEGQLQ